MIGQVDYLDLIDRALASDHVDKSDISDKSPAPGCAPTAVHSPEYDFGRFGRFGRTFSELERRCPDLIDVADWQAAVEDGRRFLARWGDQADALGWSADDLFGLAPVPEKVTATYRRLSRVELTGLIWLLRGRTVVALTEGSAAIQVQSKSILNYRRQLLERMNAQREAERNRGDVNERRHSGGRTVTITPPQTS
jgi:hypothetical protein